MALKAGPALAVAAVHPLMLTPVMDGNTFPLNETEHKSVVFDAGTVRLATPLRTPSVVVQVSSSANVKLVG
jgi:hypothetical protein